eukprot:1148400-Pelagomonas_calceolata.AAC.3
MEFNAHRQTDRQTWALPSMALLLGAERNREPHMYGEDRNAITQVPNYDIYGSLLSLDAGTCPATCLKHAPAAGAPAQLNSLHLLI